MKKLFIGVSGWAYSHWEDIFYPKNLSPEGRLKYFSHYFKTVEINYSFYHLPEPAVYKNWYSQTPGNFLFAVKASRFITHIKRLKGVREPWANFLKNALNLKEKLGPILLQLPPSFRCSAENVSRIKEFLEFTEKIKNTNRNLKLKKIKIRLAVEIRNSSFNDSELFELLKKFNVALVVSDAPAWDRIEKPEIVDFAYVRMHGSKVLFSSKYTAKELKDLAQKIKKWLGKGLDVYCYFNNDAAGYALENAKTLMEFLQ